MTYDEFYESLELDEHDKSTEQIDAFILFCFLEIFKDDTNANDFLALALAQSFARAHYFTASKIVNKSCRLRFKKAAPAAHQKPRF